MRVDGEIGDIDESPYFYTLVEVIARHIGSDTVAGLKSAFALSEADEIRNWIYP